MSGLIWIQLFDSLMVFLIEILKKLILKKNQQTKKKHAKLPSRQRVNDDLINNSINYCRYASAQYQAVVKMSKQNKCRSIIPVADQWWKTRQSLPTKIIRLEVDLYIDSTRVLCRSLCIFQRTLNLKNGSILHIIIVYVDHKMRKIMFFSRKTEKKI